MWEKEIRYKFALKKNLIYDFCHQAYRMSSSFDVTFITRDKTKVPGHRIILGMSSELIKGFGDSSHEVNILLPDYSHNIVSSFVQFLYTGECILDVKEKNDFISICKQLIVNVPCLNDTIKEEQIEVEEAIQFHDETQEFDAVENEELDGDQDLITEDETCEIEHPLAMVNNLEESTGQASSSETQYLVRGDNLPNFQISLIESGTCQQFEYKQKPAVVHKESCDQKSNIRNLQEDEFSQKRKSTRNVKHKQSIKLQRLSEQKLLEAIDAVQRGVKPMTAARQFGVPKTTLYRKLNHTKADT